MDERVPMRKINIVGAKQADGVKMIVFFKVNGMAKGICKFKRVKSCDEDDNEHIPAAAQLLASVVLLKAIVRSFNDEPIVRMSSEYADMSVLPSRVNRKVSTPGMPSPDCSQPEISVIKPYPEISRMCK